MRRNRIASRQPPVEICISRFTKAEQQSLWQLATSDNVADRRLCMEYLRLSYMAPNNRRFIIEIADQLIPDRSQRIRWGILVVLGNFARSHPEELWPVVVKWGSAKSADIRTGVACCILEHILEDHFKEYFEKAKALILDGNYRFFDTLSVCWKSGQAKEPENAKAFDSFLAMLNGTAVPKPNIRLQESVRSLPSRPPPKPGR